MNHENVKDENPRRIFARMLATEQELKNACGGSGHQAGPDIHTSLATYTTPGDDEDGSDTQ